MARLAAGERPNEAPIRDALAFIDERNDCADFRLHGILRLLYQFRDDPRVSAALAAQCKETVLRFKYWPDEPGVDSMCTWSENHHILLASAGLLAGRLYPNEVFANSGRTGGEMAERHRPRVARWLELRFRTGFSEWLSNVYYDEDLVALLNLVDFADDTNISNRAAMVTDLLFADIALNSFRGTFGSTHGRCYEREKKRPSAEHTATAAYLAFGKGSPRAGSMSGTCLALSTGYRVPRALAAIVDDTERSEFVNRQRIGIRVAEGRRWGLGYDSFEDGMTWLSLEAYAHPKTLPLTVRMLDAFDWWENSFFQPFALRRKLIENARRFHALPLVAQVYRHDLGRNTREQVDVHTYRTPDYMLSTAQDYRKGYGGDQQHIWQAALGGDAVCFTTHPAPRTTSGSTTPNYWAGSGTLPRAAQAKNVCIVVYRLRGSSGLYQSNDLMFTHAWLPKDRFDEIVEIDGWVFARKGAGYLALRSQLPYTWQQEGEDKDREMIAPGRDNIWICELGREETDGAFVSFCDRVRSAKIEYRGARVVYGSPSQGQVSLGWRAPFVVNGARVDLHPSARYDNPYVHAAFPAETLEFRVGGDWLRLDWNTGERSASAFE